MSLDTEILADAVGTPEHGDVVLSVADLTVSFGSEAGRVDAVRGLSYDLRAGMTTAIVGESGSGKSVSAMAILGLLPDSARVGGSVRLHGRELNGRSDKEMSTIRGREIAMVFQDPLSSLTPVFTVGDQIVEALQAHQKLTKKSAWVRAVELLGLVGIPDPARRAKAFPHELSGGMRQRVMIAMAIANDPSVIIADEPTTALDVTIQAQILELLDTAQRETGAAVLLITHDLGVVAGSADDVVVMYAGRAVETADVDTLFHAPRMPYTVGLLEAVPRVDRRSDTLTPIPGTPPLLIDPADECLFAPRCPIARDECRSTEPALRAIGAGRAESVPDHLVACVRADDIADGAIDGSPIYPLPQPDSRADRAPRDDRPPVLQVENLRKEFPLTSGLLKRRVGTVRAVNGVTFDIRRGESLAIVGESGSGKSTTLLEVMDFAQPAGVVRIGGVDPAAVPKREARSLRREVSIVFQDPAEALDPRFTAFDIVVEPLRALGVPRAEADAKVEGLLRRVGLDPAHADRFPAAFSGGQRQRLAIARALATEPSLIILDEPLSALDVSVQADIVNLIRELQSVGDVAYLVVAHDLSVVRHLADRVAVMYLGEFVEVGETETVFDEPAHPYTRALLSAVPIPDPVAQRNRNYVPLTGEQPSPTAEIVGCAFAGRCPLHARLDPDRQQRCRTEAPTLRAEVPTLRAEAAASADHEAACHYLGVDA
ncbi:dipeptide ABC transporter ATP-binding protein [Gordonia sp. ABSL1-1]|uniref:dipeptide ABC transporter ATP-binding protein n=1 Tax=Gordonia sp. ABSL1-1 TaxID=3053923 RepID=UPI002573A48C|nr:dipeptide ABC transporter ATP-binding protein [Gordonia sp. ABSL1-1]MDL9937482.1 dipeptide ABC transporter ATP-binding protein [Gordonia sp. ABSL1-1]